MVEFGRRVLHHWWWLIVSAAGGIYTLAAVFADITIPTWVGVLLMVLGLFVAQLLAFREVAKQRDEALAAATPPRGSVFSNQTIRITDFIDMRVADHPSPLITERTFEDCIIVGPAVIALIDQVTMLSPVWDASRLEEVFIEVPTGSFVIGPIGLIRCTFIRCRFHGIGVMGTPQDKVDMAAAHSYPPQQTTDSPQAPDSEGDQP
jgi:hypothetical protein